MRNFKMTIQYEGTKYQGWQKQESTGNTIQGRLEAILSKMTDTKVEIQGAGRTDTGVHALQQIANFHLQTQKKPEELMEYINQYLPEDIGVTALVEVPERFHSRLNAKGKIYCYRVVNSKIPHIFTRKYVHVVPEKLDIKAMNQAAEYLVGQHDFKAFTSTKKGKKPTVRTIDSIKIEKIGNSTDRIEEFSDEIRFTFSGNGFLYHMIRIMMGTLIEVGAHKRKPEEITAILESGSRELAGALVPAKGLILLEVRY